MNAINADESDAADDNANDEEADDEKQGDVPEMTAKDEAEVRQWIETHGVQMTDDILETEVRVTYALMLGDTNLLHLVGF